MSVKAGILLWGSKIHNNIVPYDMLKKVLDFEPWPLRNDIWS